MYGEYLVPRPRPHTRTTTAPLRNELHRPYDGVSVCSTQLLLFLPHATRYSNLATRDRTHAVHTERELSGSSTAGVGSKPWDKKRSIVDNANPGIAPPPRACQTVQVVLHEPHHHRPHSGAGVLSDHPTIGAHMRALRSANAASASAFIS